MDKLPAITGGKLLKALLKDGFTIIRQKGSHVVVSKNVNGEEIIFPVPVHKGKNIKTGTLNGIMRSAGMTKERLKHLLTLMLI